MKNEFSEDFIEKWILSKAEIDSKLELVDSMIKNVRSTSPLYENFFEDKEIVPYIDVAKIMARLKPITNKMLADFILGISNLRFANDDSNFNDVIRLMEPAAKVYMEFYETEESINWFVNKGIAENGNIKIGNVSFQITKQAITLHVKKKKIRPVSVKDVEDAEVDYVKFKNDQFKEINKDNSESNNIHNRNDNKPTFKTDIVGQFFDIIKDFFDSSQQPELKKILNDGTNVNEKLVFKDNGKRLADAFKQMYEGGLIVGCSKKALEDWIRKNFLFVFRSKTVEYKAHYLNDIISSNRLSEVKKPLLNVIKGTITK